MKLIRFSRPTRTATIAIASAAAGIALAVPGLAVATHSGQDVPAPPANPTRASQIQNIDQVKTAIKGYYGDTVTTTIDPVPNSIDGGDVALHTFNPDGAYAHEVEGIAGKAGKFLATHHKHTAGKAVLFDIDDTTLNTYNYEIYSNFVYNPTTNAALRELRRVPGRAGHGRPRAEGPGQGIRGVLPDGSARGLDDRPDRRHAHQPDQRRLHGRPEPRVPQGQDRRDAALAAAAALRRARPPSTSR